MLTLVVAVKLETLCELLLFVGRKGLLNAAGLLKPLRRGKPAPKKIWETIQTLFSLMNEIQELVAVSLGSKTRVVFTLSPGYASMPPVLKSSIRC